VISESKQMNKRQRIKELRAKCADWDLIIGRFVFDGMRKRDAELGILALIDAGLIRIEPNPNGPTAFVLTTPDGLEGVLPDVAQ
jgi:hypothetical protein